MTNKEAITILVKEVEGIPSDVWDEQSDKFADAVHLAIKALNNEVYWEDVKQALNGWLNNTTSPNTALNDIYRAYMGKGDAV